MKTATLSELKKELATQSPQKLQELCLRLAKYKKENKELLTYLLFESGNEQAYVESIKEAIVTGFSEINTSNLYYAKKGLRKVLRMITRYSRYSGSPETDVELLLVFLKELKALGIPTENSVVLTNLVNQQIKKIEKGMAKLHEDLQYDYQKELSLYQG